MTPSSNSTPEVNTAPPPLREAIQKLEENISHRIKVQDIPGIALAIFSRDEVYYRQGFGVKKWDSSDPITPTTLFQMASVSKPLSATAFALLEQKGLCSFNDHPNDYLPTLFKGDAYKNLTIKHMANHTSGIPYDGFEDLIETYVPREHILKVLKNTPMTSNPGEKFVYNNVVYGLIGDIMVAVAGKSIEAVLKEYLFDPLSMDKATVGFAALLDASDRAYPYMEDPDGKLIAAPHYSHSYYIFPTSAGINACVNDLIPFIQLYFGKYPQIISKEALAPLHHPTINASESLEFLGDPRGLAKEAWYGLGWLLTNLGQEKLVYHTGYLNGVRNFVAFLPTHDIGIVLLANSERKVASSLGLEFFYHYLGLGE
jgi:beta-lactamase class C